MTLRPMNRGELRAFLREHIEPLEDPIYGKRYRVAARLVDGTFLPCVVFQNRRNQVELALRRFQELARNPDRYKSVVGTLVSSGSHLAEWAVASVEESPYAWPPSLLKTIHGETAMSWTSFVAEMTDGTLHSFGTTFHFEFFDLPNGYSYHDVKSIRSGMVYSVARGLAPYSHDALNDAAIFRERPFFVCYLDDLE